ncbi:hypothetical protein B0H19DRAFT_1248838 [Mycena capillaripes]|nr:hypothetical protein B0H19DRAFT_1248838 [Mycena capillaripes]
MLLVAIVVNTSLRRVAFESADNHLAQTLLSTLSESSKAPNVESLGITLRGAFEPLIYASIAKFRGLRQLDHSRSNGPLSSLNYTKSFSELESLEIEGGFKFINAAITRNYRIVETRDHPRRRALPNEAIIVVEAHGPFISRTLDIDVARNISRPEVLLYVEELEITL